MCSATAVIAMFNSEGNIDVSTLAFTSNPQQKHCCTERVTNAVLLLHQLRFIKKQRDKKI